MSPTDCCIPTFILKYMISTVCIRVMLCSHGHVDLCMGLFPKFGSVLYVCSYLSKGC